MGLYRYGIELAAPKDKRPGYYAQIVKKISQTADVLDRDGNLLIVGSAEERNRLRDLFAAYGAAGETFDLMLVPADARCASAADDYGFVSSSRQLYMYADKIARFAFADDALNEDDRMALAQMREHILCEYRQNGRTFYIIDRELTPLIERIARVYHSHVEFFS
ncbi:hypothetical protein BSNK01_15180 [Bacillaceae bacterium]